MDQASALAFGTAAYDSMYAEHPGVLAVDGTSYACSVVYGVRNRLGQTGAWKAVQTASIQVPKSALAVPPAIGKLVTVGGASRRVERVGGQNTADATWKLFLVEP